jgi:hypothetical protein
MPFRLGARDAHLGEVVPSGGTHMATTSVTPHSCLPKRVSEGRQTLPPCDDGALSAIKFHLSGKELVLQFSDYCQGGN